MEGGAVADLMTLAFHKGEPMTFSACGATVECFVKDLPLGDGYFSTLHVNKVTPAPSPSEPG